MALPGTPQRPPISPAGFDKVPLTPDDFERLATAFRPSWELDEAPFTGAGSLSTAEIRALQGGGTHVDVRATAQAAGGAVGHLPAKPSVVVEEPANKVIVDSGFAAPPAPAAVFSPPSQPPPAPEAAPPRPRIAPAAGPWAAAPSAPSPAMRSPAGAVRRPSVRPPPDVAARPRLKTEPAFARSSSKMGLWIGGGLGALALVGGIVWLSSGPDRPVAAPLPVETVPAEKALPSIPPPPPEQAAATPKQPPPPPPAAPPVVMASALPQVPQQQPASSPPPPRPVMMTAPQPHPVSSPPPAPKPATASRPKGTTIVRDVPF